MTGLRIKDNKEVACFNLRSGGRSERARVQVATSRNGTCALEGMSEYMVRAKVLEGMAIPGNSSMQAEFIKTGEPAKESKSVE